VKSIHRAVHGSGTEYEHVGGELGCKPKADTCLIIHPGIFARTGEYGTGSGEDDAKVGLRCEGLRHAQAKIDFDPLGEQVYWPPNCTRLQQLSEVLQTYCHSIEFGLIRAFDPSRHREGRQRALLSEVCEDNPVRDEVERDQDGRH